jgi:hypothetical protein
MAWLGGLIVTRYVSSTMPDSVRPAINRARVGAAWGSLVTSGARQILEHAIEVRCGGIYLRLTPGQYAKLRS